MVCPGENHEQEKAFRQSWYLMREAISDHSSQSETIRTNQPDEGGHQRGLEVQSA
jgi:hypothetical protein